MCLGIRHWLIAAAVGFAACLFAPETAQSFGSDNAAVRGDQGVVVRVDHHDKRRRYWNNYWGWYDRSYRPYWHRRYRYDHRPYRDRHDDDFGFRPSRGYRYYSPYGYRRYGHSLRRPHNSLQLGPLHLDWR